MDGAVEEVVGVVEEVVGVEATVIDVTAEDELAFPEALQPAARTARAVRTLAIALFFTWAPSSVYEEVATLPVDTNGRAGSPFAGPIGSTA